MKEVDPIEILDKARRQRQCRQEEQQWLEALRKRATPQRLAGWCSLVCGFAVGISGLVLSSAVTARAFDWGWWLPQLLLASYLVWQGWRQLDPDPRDRLLLRLAEKVLGEEKNGAIPTSSPCSETDGRRSGSDGRR